MKQKVFNLLTLLVLCVTGAWADPVTIGLTQLVTDAGDTHTVGDPAYTGTTNLTVTKSIGSSCGDGYTGKTVTVGSPGVAYTVSKAFRKTVNGAEFVDAQYVGYTMTVASGYKVSLTNLNAEFWSSDATMTWRVVVLNPSGTAIYTSSTAQNNSNNKGTITVVSPTGLSNLTAGIYTIKLQMHQSGGNKYFVVPSLTFSAIVEEDQSTSYTVTTSAGAGGTVSPSGENSVVEGQNFSVLAAPNTGYAFVNWTLDGADGGTSNPLSINNVTADHIVVANFKQLYTINFNVDAVNKGTATTGLGTQYANALDKWTASTNYYFFKEGYTLTKWNDGGNDYTPGTEYTLAGNITVAPVFTENAKNLSDLTAETTISWPFATNNGAPTLSSEGNTQYYVKQTTIAGETVDVPIYVNTTQDYGISGKKGKFVSSATNCQVNAGTVFKIPAIQGMVVKYMTSQNTAVGNIGFTDNTENLGGDGTALTTPTVISGDNKTISYTYTGTASYLYLVDKAGGKYPTGISVTYPEKKTKYLAPTITVGDFSFADKAYPVTITAVEGTLYVSTDGENYTAQTSPYEVNVTATTHFYAKATGASYDDSDVVDENVTNTFDGGKSYVAWVYESNYANAPSNYNVANDEIYKALNAIYNVVLVDIKDYKSSMTDDQKTALNGNLDDADLVVISEAAAGGSKAVIGLKDIIGTVPMLNMKFFAYTYNSTPSNNRWGWGTPKNADNNVDAITPASKFYKVLNGVIFDGDDVALFSYPNDQKHIQYVDSWTAEPSGDVVLATITVSSVAKPVMHASTKYFALGLSCDDFTKYNSNAIAIVKNAAAMLIAGEALNTEMATVTATVGANGYTTFASSYPLDLTDANRPAGLKAYKATRDGANLTFTALNQTVPAGTGLLLLGETKGGNYDIPVAASGDAVSSNALVGVIAPTAKQSDPSGNYYFVMKKAASDSDALAFAPLSTSSAVTIPAGKAYVEVPNSAFSGGANELTISFEEDGDVTGIKNLTPALSNGEGMVYDLQGRRVAQPAKGLYIVNGKKVVLK